MGRHKSLGSPKSFLSYTSELSGASILRFNFSRPDSSVLITGSGSHLIAATSQVFLFFCFFPVTQIVKNPPAMWETRVRSRGWEDPLEKEMANHSSILAWREFDGLRSLAGYSP